MRPFRRSVLQTKGLFCGRRRFFRGGFRRRCRSRLRRGSRRCFRCRLRRCFRGWSRSRFRGWLRGRFRRWGWSHFRRRFWRHFLRRRWRHFRGWFFGGRRFRGGFGGCRRLRRFFGHGGHSRGIRRSGRGRFRRHGCIRARGGFSRRRYRRAVRSHKIPFSTPKGRFSQKRHDHSHY